MEQNQQVCAAKTSQAPIAAYWPIGFIYVISLGLATFADYFHAIPDYMSHFMGYVLVFFGVIKLNDIRGFATGFSLYDPIAERSSLYAKAYPFLEIILGVLFLTQILVIPATIVTLVVYSASLYGAVRSIRKNEELHCVCLGTYFKLPLSTVTIIESLVMILMSIWMLVMINTMSM